MYTTAPYERNNRWWWWWLHWIYVHFHH